MHVSPTEPFQIIYSIYEHQYLGLLYESYIVQLNAKGELTYQYQNVSSKNIQEFASGISKNDVELVKLMDAIQQDAILRRFNKKGLKTFDFFQRVFRGEKPDLATQGAIVNFLEKYRIEILPKLIGSRVFVMTNDGIPIGTEVTIPQEKAKVYFNFKREENHTIYFPVVKCAGERVKIQFTGTQMLLDKPAFILSQNVLYHFDEHVEAKKLKPFFNKGNILIDRKIEKTYYQKFVGPLISQFNVFAEGFEIRNEQHGHKGVLAVSEYAKAGQSTLFNDDVLIEDVDQNGFLQIDLYFDYGRHRFRFESMAAPNYVEPEQTEDSWIFHKVERDLNKEKEVVRFLRTTGLELKHGRLKITYAEFFDWLHVHGDELRKLGVEIEQALEKEYFLGTGSLEISIVENQDWFDIKAKVRFGEFEISIIKLRELVLGNRREFRLPNGLIAVIPQEWFDRYSELFALSNLNEEDFPTLPKNQFMYVQNLEKDGLATSVINRRLRNLEDFRQIEAVDVPKNFKGTLRPYQKAGYDWLHFLNTYNMGGCLADDMGLGKTVTTLAFLQALKNTDRTHPTLLVMPTSLIYNWKKESEKFTPELKVLIHAGSFREKSSELFEGHDLILTSYGVVRMDIDWLRNYRFDYVILDESQAIKNPTSNISQSVKTLNSRNRLILTGTPLENSTMDLWSQFTFINPGLLGSQSFFRDSYQIPIEKQQNEAVSMRLHARVKPFMLRRHKSQVATELPEKIETVQYCDMSPEQEKIYEETKAEYRNLLLEQIESKGMNRSQMMVLQGLSKLRQLANNPLMVDPDFVGESGKDADVIHKLNNTIENGSKVLVFSQYVKHLTIFKGYLEMNDIPFAYLDGSTKNREEQVNKFQNEPEIKVFLISLKAGGVGLNLTAAEYVFLLDPWWNPAIEAQAVDRAHRIGQKKTVFTYRFISRNTVEEKILTLQNAKKRLFQELVTTESSFLKSLSQKDIMALLD